MEKLKVVNDWAYQWLMNKGPGRWAHVKSPLRRYTSVTSNIAECMNSILLKARKMQITIMIEYIRDRCMLWFQQRYREACGVNTNLSKHYNRLISELDEKVKHYRTRKISTNEFLVLDNENNGTVDFLNKTCTCGQFQLNLMPCKHVIAVFGSPLRREQAGRPKAKRIRSAGEFGCDDIADYAEVTVIIDKVINVPLECPQQIRQHPLLHSRQYLVANKANKVVDDQRLVLIVDKPGTHTIGVIYCKIPRF
ncbi:hypothetical protein Cni_G02598 [Canna indica]|uniref:SWIM-type domain-containing protein n=1 Tax=Canna indica TaxID=4628 RepID=A0AAQ3JQB0_9LILI|nr:hypothetical protein Cni_G02598 [Canna indica]